MYRATLLLAIALMLRVAATSSAELIVNPARPITHRVSVQMIQTALDNGSSPAPLFGDPTRDAAIKSVLDTIWSQAGIDVQFLPNVVRYNNTFATQGLGVGVRPFADLDVMMANAAVQGGILNPNPSVINMFFVNVVPGFDPKASNWVNGLSNVGVNGIAMYVGTGTSAEHAGHWLAHEIGHNLGLLHASSQNLMTSSRNTEYLTGQQISAVFSKQGWEDAVASVPFGGTGFPQPMFAQMPGDYDRNGNVDAADYAMWRNTLNSTSDISADGNGNGIIDQSDLTVWRANFGRTSGFAAATFDSVEFSFAGQVGTPEPAGLALLLFGVAALSLNLRRPR